MKYFIVLCFMFAGCAPSNPSPEPFDMVCFINNKGFRRCENKEVVCYTHGGVTSCMPKEWLEDRD